MTRLGVLGWPVAHSRSPAIQNAALAAVGLGETWRYQLLPVPPDHFEETVRALPEGGFRGVNVTIPHKHAALALATTATARATAIGAANTLLFERDGAIHADNTDAPALAAALAALAVSGNLPALSRCSALVLGAGGSARAAVWALLDAGVTVHVWNRTRERAVELCKSVGGVPAADVNAVDPVDVLVNCTSIGLDDADSLADLPIDPNTLTRHGAIVDFVYAAQGTPLLNAAREAGVPTVDGLELLVGQGALSFELFTGIAAPLEAMRRAVGLSSAR